MLICSFKASTLFKFVLEFAVLCTTAEEQILKIYAAPFTKRFWKIHG